MGKTQSNLERLYGAVSAQFDIGTFEEFRAKMNTPEDRRRFYDAVDANGFDLGNYDEYERRLGGVQEVSAQGSAGTSETSGQPSGSLAEPLLGNQPAQAPVDPTPEQVGKAVTDFEAQQIANVGNRHTDRYVPEDATVVTPIDTSAGPSVATLGDDGEIFNVIPPVDVVASDTMTFQTSVRNTFDNLVNQIRGIDDRLSLVAAESWERLLGKELAASWYEYDGRDINQVKMDAYAELERLESEMKQTQSVSGAITSGDPVAILAASINALSALGGTALASITTGGVGLYTEMMGSAIYDFNKTKAEELGLTVEELYEQGKAEFATPATIGVIGGALERVGFRGAQRAFLAQINSQAGRRLLKAGLGANQEGMTEWLQTGLEAVNERMAEGDASTFDISSVFVDALFSEEGLEAYLMGAVGSASASGLGRMGGAISSRVANRDLADNINQGFDTLASIEQDLSNPEISPSTQAVLRGQQDAIVSEISDNIIESNRQEDTLPAESKNEVEGLLSRLEELQAVIQDPNVSETTKESLRAQAEQVSGEIDTIISNSQDTAIETSVVQEPAAAPETPTQELSELQSEYDTLGIDLQEGRITQEEFDASADSLYESILLRRDADALEARMFEERAAQRQIEVDAAISEFQQNNPDVEVDLFEDLPDSVVRTFERVDRGVPTDPVALEEASSWMYDKYQSVLDERNNPERRHTIEQLNSIANQIGEDITILENYRYEQQNETESVQLETEASNIPSQPEQEAERVEATGQQESEVTTEAETSPVRDDLSSDEAMGQLTAEVSSEAPLEAVSDGGVVSDVEQEADPVSVEDVQSEREQSEVSLTVAERPVRITDDMPPKQPDNARVKSLLRMLPRQDTAAMMGPANVEYRRDVIESITGERPTKKDAGITNVRRAIADYLGIDLENTSGVNFADMVRNWANSPDSSPKKSSSPSRQANRYVNSDVSDSVASNPEEVTREFAERTDDPDLIADAYNNVMPREPDYIEEGIANYLGGGRINRRDFNSIGDRNRSSQPLASRWLDASNSQLGLDVMAQELSDQLGVEVTEQDFIDFVERYRGKNDFEQSRKSAEQEILEDRYKELTGRNLTPRVAESARRRLDAEITDRDLLESSPVFRELGITYEDVLDYEEFHRQSDQGGAENVPSQESVGSTAVADGGARPQEAKPKTPKTLLKGVADRLSKTGLAKSVKIMTSKEIVADLTGRSNVQFQTDQAELADIEAKAKADGTWMKAPNGKPTNLNEKQWVQVRSKAFKDWFGDWENDPANASKVVDENGEPLVVYHGTPNHFNEFREGVSWFSDHLGYATDYKLGDSGNLLNTFLNIKNPADLDLYYTHGFERLQELGYDGTKLIDTVDGLSARYTTFNPNQIKSATDNVGTFDPSNPDIRFQASAWHGSPHVFDKFSASAIGTGEGAQAFGWGLYFTDLESIARNYANALVGKPNHTGNSTVDWVIDVKKPANKNELLKELEKILNEKEDTLNNNVLKDNIKERFENEIKEVQEGISIVSSKDYNLTFGRNLYSVTLHKGKTPSEYTWLEWDKNITTEFNDRIRKQAKKEGLLTKRTGKSDIISGVVPTGAHFITEGVNGEAIYDSLEKTFGSSKEASLFLLRAGIDGIKYPAESVSSGATSDTAKGFNYVVFDENAVEIEERIQFQKGEDINGYVDAEGNIVINSDTAGLDTPIHEFAHIWERTIETQNPFLHQRGMELIQTEEGKPYVDHVKKTQPGLTGRALYKEALAQAIGDRGARIIESQKNSSIKQWLKDAWDFIAKMVGLSEMSMSDISTLTLNEFADAAAVDLLSGKQFARLENGDTVAKTTATSESRMDNKDKFMSDFMTRMRKRNGMNYQGQVDGSLSDGDFSELITFFNYGTEKGLINGLSDAKAAAESMGINSPGQVERAYKISQIRAKAATGFKVSEVSEDRIANADFNKVSDREYLAIGKDMVDSGLVKPYDLVNSILTDPRALQPEEVAAMQYYRTQIESDIYDLQKLVDSGSESEVSSFNFNGARGYDGIAAKMEVINQSLFDLDMAILATASQQSAAFRLRSVMADRDFNIVTYLAELKARGFVDPKLEAKLKKLSNELNSVRSKLKRKSKEAEALAEQISQGNIVQEGTQPVRQTRMVRHKNETVEAVNRVLDSLDMDSFALPGMSFQANSTLRFQVNPNPAVSEAVRSAVEKMKLDVSEGRSSLSDALESAVESVNSAVGEGNWDSVKFRSVVANGLVQNSIPVKVRKPYVNSDGVLVIPGEYLKSLVREGVDTIEKMVPAASAELDGQFSEYDIRNAISGYGRQSASHRTDLDRKISKARRIANLLSQIEDLETKGERVRTAKQKHDNDTEINNLKDTVRQLEYDLEMTPEERAQYDEQRYNEQRQRYLRNYIAQVQDRIDNKDFAPVKHRNRYEDDAETTALRKEAESIKNEFKKEKYRHELENRTPSEKFRALAYDILFNITRGLSAGADASAIGVQGAIYTFARPKDAYKMFAGSMKGTFSEQEYQDYFTEMQSDPFYEMARNAGLNLQLPNFYQSVQEEQYKGQLPELMWNKIINDPAAFMASKFTRKPNSEIRDALYDKANPFTLGDRNYSLVLSKMRFDMFKEFMANQINKRGVNTEIDTDTIKQVAEIVNTITMASKVPGLEGKLGNDIVSAIMFSARKFIATWKILGAWAPLLMGSSRNTQLFYDSYGGVIGKGLGTMFAIAAIPTAIASWMKFDDEDDEEPYFYNPYFLDPRHSDFMKLRMGNTRVSLFQGIDGNVIWATRFVTGEYMTSSSRQVKPLNGEQFNKTRLSLTWDYISNKFAPTTGSAVRLLGGDRDRIEGMERFRESLAPMWATGIWEQYQDTGNVAETSALGVLGMFGLAYNNYGGAEFASKRGTDNKKAVEIFERSGLSAYDPGRNQRTYFDGKKMSSVSGSLYSDSYLPAYQKYMTEAVLSNEARFSKNVHWEHKEGLIKSMKRDAYKYAEIESSGVYARAGFDKFSIDGVQYKLLESQYSDKAKHIKNYMDKLYKRDIREAKTSVRTKMRSEGIKATPAYVEMQEKLYLYNKASAYANQMMYNDMRRGKMKLFKSTEVTVDTVLDEE